MSRIYINLNEEYMGAIYASNDDESVFENLNIEYVPIIIGINEKNELVMGKDVKENKIIEPCMIKGDFIKKLGSSEKIKLGNLYFTSQELVSHLLKYLKKQSKKILGEEAENAVISIPSYFTESEKRALEHAADISNINIEKLISESDSSVYAYDFDEDEIAHSLIVQISIWKRSLEYSVVSLNHRGYAKSKPVYKDDSCGMDAFTEALVKHFYRLNNIDESILNHEEIKLIYLSAQNCIESLDYNDSGKMEAEIDKREYIITVSIDEFKKICFDVMMKIRASVKKTLEKEIIKIKSSLCDKANYVDKIIITGKCAEMSVVQSLFRKMFPEKSIYSNKEARYDKVIGTAVYSMLSDKWNEIIEYENCNEDEDCEEEDENKYLRIRERYSEYKKSLYTIMKEKGYLLLNSELFHHNDFFNEAGNTDYLIEVTDFIKKAESLYNDFSSRIDIYKWIDLFDREIIWDIDQSHIINDRLLNFLSSHRYFPCEIWRLLNEIFDWKNQKSIIYETYPEEFAHYIYSVLTDDFGLVYKYFKGTEIFDYEQFFKYRQMAFNCILNKELEKAEEYLRYAEMIYVDDPDLSLIKGICYFMRGDIENALSIFENLVDMDRQYVNARYWKAKALHFKGEDEKAYDELRYVEKYGYNKESFYMLYAECCFNNHDYFKAKEIIVKLKDTTPESEELYHSINRNIADELSKKLKADKKDTKIRNDLYSIYRELGVMNPTEMREVIFLILRKAAASLILLLIIQYIFVYITMNSMGLRKVPSMESLAQLAVNYNKETVAEDSEDIYRFKDGIGEVSGTLKNACFTGLYRIPSKENILYVTHEEADAMGIYGDMNGYVCFGLIGDKNVIMITNYDEAKKIYNNKTIDFKGLIYNVDTDVFKDYFNEKGIGSQDKLISGCIIDTTIKKTAIYEKMAVVLVCLGAEVFICIFVPVLVVKIIKKNKKRLKINNANK